MIFLSLLLYCTFALANLARFDSNQHSQVCAGVYSKKDWGGSIKPHIGLSLKQYQDHKYNSKNKDAKFDDINVSYIIFEYKDINLFVMSMLLMSCTFVQKINWVNLSSIPIRQIQQF